MRQSSEYFHDMACDSSLKLFVATSGCSCNKWHFSDSYIKLMRSSYWGRNVIPNQSISALV